MQNSPYPCLCTGFRKSGRILTRKYDLYLKPSGLKVTQYSMLANIVRNPGITVSELAKLLVMDQTTVTRNLRVLERLGYINMETETADLRVKRIQVSDVGMTKIREARPFWEKAQSEMEAILGSDSIECLLKSFQKIAD